MTAAHRERTRRIDIAGLAGGAAAVRSLDGDGRPIEPLLAVELDDVPSHDVLDAAVSAAAVSDRILVGIAAGDVPPELAAALDLTLAPYADRRHVVAVADPEAELDRLRAAAAANPHAATVLRGVLRAGDGLPVPAALDVESFAYSTLLGGPEFAAWLARRGERPPPPVAAEPVLIDRVGNTLRITLNRPERRNAYGRQVRDALVAALDIALLDSGIDRVEIDGAGPSFCAGGDLDEFGTTPDLVTAHLVRTRAGAALPLHRLAGQVMVHVHGACVGAGIELPAFAARVTASADATFRLPEVRMGLIPGAGGTVSLPRRIGRWRTLYLALTGTTLDAATSLVWGLVDDVQ